MATVEDVDTSSPELDVSKLHSLPTEHQDLYLLTFATSLARHVEGLDGEGASAQQIYVKKEVFKIISLSSPVSTRVIRNSIGQCLAGIFKKGDRKLLFDTINELLGLINTSSKLEIVSKHVAVHCLGAIFEAVGDSAVSLVPITCSNILRLLKTAQNHAGYRATLIRAVGKIVLGAGNSTDEILIREIWKQIRPATTDKALIVQASACWCLQQLFQECQCLNNSNDFEKLLGVLWKTLDSASPLVRRAAASCLSAVLIKSYSASPSPDTVVRRRSKKAKSKLQDDGANQAENERSSSPVPVSVTKLSFGVIGICRQLSLHYCRLPTSNRVRAGIVSCYMRVLKGLPEGVTERHYDEIALHLFQELLCHSSIANNRYRLLITRKFVRIILGQAVGRRLLGETGQQNAIKFLVSGILKDYPQSDIKERIEPKKEVLIASLDAVTDLIELLGSATAPLAELCSERLMQVLEHPSYSVQVHTSQCLQALVLACPQQLLPVVTVCMNSLNREMGLLTGPRKSPRRCLGLALGLASTVSTSSSQPLYGSVEVYSRVLSQATSLLKSSSNSDLKISSVQIQVAWTLIGGLMSLGPNFVKIHLSQLLLLWKNALPKPLSSDNIGQRGLLELSFLSHVRQCALGSVVAFLSFNSRLLTIDVSKRLATMLQNTIMFLGSLPLKRTTDDVDKHLFPSLQLRDYELMIRRRVFHCYAELLKLSPQECQDTLLQSNILSIATSSFANPQAELGISLSASIASALGNFENIWDVGDNFAFGLTGLVSCFEADLRPPVDHNLFTPAPRRVDEASLNHIIRSPVCDAIEHDSSRLYSPQTSSAAYPLETSVIDVAIQLFAVAFPLQTPKVQEGVLEQISSMLASTAPQRNPAREIAVTINVAFAVLSALIESDSSQGAGNVRSYDVGKALQELLHNCISHPDTTLRSLAAEALGRLCKRSGSEFTTNEVNHLIEMIVSNRDSYARSGGALALGSIHAHLGGMAASLHLQTVLGVLSSLANDSHPVVHYWALSALSNIADSAGLAFSGNVSNTLGLLAQLYVLDSHNEECASTAFSNLEFDLPTVAITARCVNSMINVLGPDLQDASKTRNMVLTLTYQFENESLSVAMVEALRCLESLSMYASGYVPFKSYIQVLRIRIESDEPILQDTALSGLYHAMRRDAEEVLAAQTGFEDQFWLIANDMYAQGIVLSLIQDWVGQSGLQRLDIWVDRIQRVLTRTRNQDVQIAAPQPGRGAGEPDVQDDEVAGFNASVQTDKDDPTTLIAGTKELLRWQVRCAAMDCLKEILSLVVRDVSSHGGSSAIRALQPRIADIVRIAFSASTASVVELRISGIQIIRRILQIFGRVLDPEFPEVTLLEQYQAQISSALTPAFAADSSPMLAAEAVNVCAAFISAGIVTTVDRMGRILKLLISSLQDFARNSESASLGDLKGLTSNANVMVKLAIFSAWAELQVASHDQTYLEDVVRPHLTQLIPLWLESLQEYARLKFEPDISSAAAPGTLAGGLDAIYAALNRETLLSFYQACWLKFLSALASLINEDDDHVLRALFMKTLSPTEEGNKKVESNGIGNLQDQPKAFFFMLFGISFEALVEVSHSDTKVAREHTIKTFQAMQKILRLSVAKSDIYQAAIFSETMDLLDRSVLTEGLEVQRIIVEIARQLCTGHPSAQNSRPAVQLKDDLADDIDQLFELTRIIVLVISKHIDDLSQPSLTRKLRVSDDIVALIILALTALVDSAGAFPPVIKGDLHACILHVFATILSTDGCQDVVVSQALPILRGFVTSLSKNPQHNTTNQLRNALSGFLVILRKAQRRESEAALPREKNCLVACTILLTCSAKMLPWYDPLINRFLDTVVDCMGNRMTSMVSAGLARSLLLLATSGGANEPNPTELQIAVYLLPKLLAFLAKPSDVDGIGEARTVVVQALTAFALGLPEPQRPVTFDIVVPAILKRAAEEGEPTWKETSTRLVELARREPRLFKATLGKMHGEQKAFIEEVIRAGGVPEQGAVEQNGPLRDGGKEPAIALKMDFTG